MIFYWPLEKVFITQKFGNKNKNYSNGYHMGIDLRAKLDTPIYAAASGKILKIKNESPFDGYGSYIIIEHNYNNEKYFSIYAHLNQVFVKKDDKIVNGQLIGFSGGSPQLYGAKPGQYKVNGKYTKAGYSTAPHLHFEINKNRIGSQYSIDPEKITTFYESSMIEENKNFVPDWAKEAVEKAKQKGFKVEEPNTNLKKYEFLEYMNRLGLLD